MPISIKSQQDIAIIREGGHKLAAVLNMLGKNVKPGVSTQFLDDLARKLIKEAGGEPSFLNYGKPSYPSAICASVNEEVVHCPADPKKILKEGDIIGIDIGMEYKCLYTDMAATFAVGKISKLAAKLINATQEALALAIKQIKPGNKLSIIGNTIEDYLKPTGFGIVHQLVGHGVGYKVHEPPQVPNFKFKSGFEDIVLKEGMVLAIEPMINAGVAEVNFLDDGWRVVTADGNLSAHFEHTVAVTADGCEILTRS